MTTTEIERVTETAVEQATEEQEAKRLEIQAKFDAQEKKFQNLESDLAVLRGFFEKHRETLSAFDWTCHGWNGLEIKFRKWEWNGGRRRDSKN